MYQIVLKHNFRKSEPTSSFKSRIIKAKNAIERSSPLLGRGRKRVVPSVSPPQKETLRKSVSFDSHDKVFHILSLDEYTAEEQHDSFYSDEENEVMVRECMKTIDKMIKGKKINSKKYCTRGLEKLTPDAQDEKDFLRAEGYCAVLEEQENQWISGKPNPERITRKYKKAASDVASIQAHATGLRDEQFAIACNCAQP